MPNFNYPNFNNYSALSFVGTASLVGSPYEIKMAWSGAFDSKGAIWYATKVDVSKPWWMKMTFKMGGNFGGISDGDGQGGDGMAFVVQDEGSSAISASGGGSIGYGDSQSTPTNQGLLRCLAAEFDTYNNGTDPLDNDNGNHIAIHSGGSGRVNSTNVSSHRKGQVNIASRMNDQVYHDAKILYDGTTVKVFYENLVNPILSWAPGSDLGTYLGLTGGKAYVGITAAVGSAQQDHFVKSWSGSFYSGANLGNVMFRAYQ